MKHWADKVDWWRALAALAAVVGGVGFFQERLVRLESSKDGNAAEFAQIHADMRDLRTQLINCGRTHE